MKSARAVVPAAHQGLGCRAAGSGLFQSTESSFQWTARWSRRRHSKSPRRRRTARIDDRLNLVGHWEIWSFGLCKLTKAIAMSSNMAWPGMSNMHSSTVVLASDSTTVLTINSACDVWLQTVHSARAKVGYASPKHSGLAVNIDMLTESALVLSCTARESFKRTIA